jgi:small subunit ribosomal protein S11
MAELSTAARKKKSRRSVPYGHVHVLATFNNTIITITDAKGGALSSASAGGAGFRGSKKGTAYAAQVAAERAIQTAKQTYLLKVSAWAAKQPSAACRVWTSTSKLSRT